jgi:hypothetical protein
LLLRPNEKFQGRCKRKVRAPCGRSEREMPVTSAICRMVKPAPLKSSTISRRRPVSVPGRVPLLAGRGAVFSSAGAPRCLAAFYLLWRPPLGAWACSERGLRMVSPIISLKENPMEAGRPVARSALRITLCPGVVRSATQPSHQALENEIIASSNLTLTVTQGSWSSADFGQIVIEGVADAK